ncbi:Suppressor protein stp22 of temperature-sensitive alpha-factor receptor and arginine permease [Ceratocystis pirilliformis]|uniref:Suppressor protein stp22 of temperature-sensitive alpha-factor receptor and arginine permease n=1 Tax=Ceratocystis pirilliformis TaxID=259994 RepID=A0ABR3ZN25_9PEZI
MPVPQRVLNWLYSILTGEYQDINRSYYDISQALATYPNLTLQNEVHTFSNGASALMLNIYGTVPVVFRGHTYYFPISIWVPHAYPREPPIVYVTPTPKMVVRPGQHVDPQGQVYHPYISGWSTFWDKSTIIDMLAILIDVFAKEPPLTARPAPAPPPPSSIATPNPSQPSSIHQSATPAPQALKLSQSSQQAVQPPLPTHSQYQQATIRPHIPNHTAERAVVSVSGPPPPPPKQPHTNLSSANFNSANSTSSPSPAGPTNSDNPRYASPASQHKSQPSPQGNSATPLAARLSRYDSAPPLPHQEAHARGIPPQQHSTTAIAQNNNGYSSPALASQSPPAATPARGAHYNPLHPPYHSYQNYSLPQQQAPFVPAPNPPKPKPPMPDLMDEPVTPSPPPLTSTSASVAPPIPPNPLKDQITSDIGTALHAKRQETLERYTSSISGLHTQHEAMASAMQGMHAELADLAHFYQTTTTNISILRDTIAHADQIIANSASLPNVDIDELLVAPTVVSNQLYAVVAEERALNDAIFVLGRALERGRISPAVFTKTTRGLARDLFLRRALVRKIGKGMGLDM